MKLTTLILAIALLIGSSMSVMAKSVFVSTGDTTVATVYDNRLVTESISYFTTKGYSIAESKEKADYVVTVQLAKNDSGKNFNIVGCLLCGIIAGGFQVDSKITIAGTVSKNNAQIWSSSVQASDKGWFLFGILQGTSSVVNSTIKTGVTDLFSQFTLTNK